MSNRIDTIQVYGVTWEYFNSHDDIEVIREIAKRTYKKSRAMVSDDDYSNYDDDKDYFFHNKTLCLGMLEKILYKTVRELKWHITYKPQKKQLIEIEDFLRGDYEFRASFVEDVINDVYYVWEERDLLPSDEIEYFKSIEANPKLHVEFIIKHFKYIVNVICKVIKDNELNGRIFRR